MLAVLRYWQPIVSAIGALGIAWLLHTVSVNYLEKSLIAQCAEEKQATKEANDELQKNLATVRDKLAANKLRSSLCIKPTEHTASRGEYAGQNGISSDWLREYAAECEIYRQEVIALTK